MFLVQIVVDKANNLPRLIILTFRLSTMQINLQNWWQKKRVWRIGLPTSKINMRDILRRSQLQGYFYMHDKT